MNLSAITRVNAQQLHREYAAASLQEGCVRLYMGAASFPYHVYILMGSHRD